MFLQVSVCPRGQGCLLWGVPALGGCLLRGEVPGLGGTWSRGVSRPTTNGEVEGDLVQAHNQGWSWGGFGPGPHPRGKLRGIWSRLTPKGEVEGDLVQAHTQGGSWGELASPPTMATAAGGTHPTGMHSCWDVHLPKTLLSWRSIHTVRQRLR